MNRSYKILRNKMSPQARAKAAAKAKIMVREMVLQDLRHAPHLSQEHLIVHQK